MKKKARKKCGNLGLKVLPARFGVQVYLIYKNILRTFKKNRIHVTTKNLLNH